MNDLSQRIANLSPAKRALLEQRLQEKRVAGVKSQTIPRREVATPCLLSFAQQRLWFLDQFEPNSALYNIPKAVRMRGALDVEALQKALDAVVARHESLRTTFATVDGNPVQVIGDSRPVALAVVDLRAQSDEARAADMQRLLSEEAQRPFDLSRDLMLRATLLRLAEEDHVLLLTMHHIASDGWSMGVLYRELERDYTAFVTGGEALPAPPIQYADYALWQRQYLQGEREETQLAYWKRQLAGMPPVLDLPTDYPRPAIQTYRGTQQSFALSQSLNASLKTLSQKQGVTLFMTLLAAFQTLLHRYAGQDDIVVGSPIAGRNRTETEALIGLFVNNLVLRTDLSGNPTFEEVLYRVREVTLAAYTHQELPFEKLVEALQPERSLSYTSLFQVMFAFQNVPRSPLRFPGLELSPLEVNSGVAKFDLTLSIWEEAGELRGTLEYSTDLFAAATINRMLGHFQTLLEGIAANPTQRLWALPLLTPAERQQRRAWNATQRPYRREACLHTLFEEQVERMPYAAAAIYDNESLSYEALNQRANQLAHHLRGRGVGPGTLVALLMERSLEMLVGLLGVLKAGGAYVPLDPAYPSERLSFMVRDSQIAVLVTQQHLLPTLPAHQAQVVCLDSDWDALAHERQDNLISGVTAEDPAYVIYTSGSTGVPKGVIGLHRGTVNRLQWMWETYPFETEEVGCQKTALSFVDAVWEIFGPLLQGVPTVIIPDKVLKDPRRLIHTLAEKRVTRIVLVPSLLHVILDTDIDLQRRLPRLKYWTSSGEALSVELCQHFRERLPQSILLNLYGSSEVAADATAYDTRQWESLRCVPLGRPIANTQAYVLDRNLQPVPIGVTGELHVGGIGLARGYLHRPELTAEKFIPHPFSNEPGARLYKTGDLAHYLPDGNLQYLGRTDHQVKIRGVRIELGEIEAGLEQHPAVRQAVVLAQEAASGDTRLVAYIVPTQEPAPTTSELHSFLTAKLPAYMVPVAFVCLDTLPLTPSGKVDRNALPQPEGSRPQLDREFVAPHDAVERQLTHIWEDLLGVKPIGVQDDFFELGGHSLLAVQLFARIEKETGKRLPLATLFQTPTIAHLAYSLRQDGVASPKTLPGEMYHERVVSDRIRHPIASYLPPKYHPYARSTYDRLKQSSLARALRRVYIRQGANIAKTFFSYTPLELVNTLKTMGITADDTVLMHSAFRVCNGFDGTPDQVIECVLNVIGESGNLAMVSMPYTRSTAAYLQAGVPFDVQHTMSAMGIITEMFRHQPGVVRSINPAHPILVCGPAASWLIADHEHTMYSCGKGSPFEKLVHMQAKVLFFDVSLRRMTFFHYLEDLFQDTLPVKLYEEMPVESTVIDASGKTRIVKTYAFSSDSRRYRNMRNLQKEFIKSRVIQSKKIGNTRLTVVHLRQVVECAQRMVRSGTPLWTM